MAILKKTSKKKIDTDRATKKTNLLHNYKQYTKTN